MPYPHRTLALAFFTLILAWPTRPVAQTPDTHGVIRGEVIDGSGGVLPGVTVTATAAGGAVLESVVTDATGTYLLGGLPPGPVKIEFQLEGFDRAAIDLVVKAGTEAHVVQRMALARLSEAVDVVARAPEEPPPPPPPPPPVAPVPVHDQDSVCGPAKATGTPVSFGTIEARRLETKRGLYAKGDELLIEGGVLNGLAIGRNYAVRRLFHASGASGPSAVGEHTSGVVQIVAADERTATAMVVYACDEIVKGDFLAPFQPEPLRSAEPYGTPAYGAGDAARILFADAGSITGVARSMMVIDRGRDNGIRVGQRLTLFRRQGRGAGTPDVIGDAVVVAAKNDSATIRVQRAIDAIASGDWAAPQRPAAAASSSATTARAVSR